MLMVAVETVKGVGDDMLMGARKAVAKMMLLMEKTAFSPVLLRCH